MNWKLLLNPGLLTLIAVFGVGSIAMGRMIDALSLQLEKKPIYPPDGRTFLAIPAETPSWERVGGDILMSKDVVVTLGTENYVSRVYQRKEPGPDGQIVQVEFHGAYYTDDIDTVPHVPERCFVGGGLQQSDASRVVRLDLDTSRWREDTSIETDDERIVGNQGVIYKTRTIPQYRSRFAEVRLPRDVGPESPLPFRLSEFRSNRGRGSIFAGYFFIANGGAVGSAEAVRGLSFNLSDEYAYYAKVQITSVSGISSSDEHEKYSAELLSELMAEIMLCLPDWVDVQTGAYDPEGGEAEGGA
ncbi:MAG: exosortase-associated EpsI family protein [Planctomycetota bacterium]